MSVRWATTWPMATKPAYAAAHILLDVLSVMDFETPEVERDANAIQMALEQFNERDLFGATVEQIGGEFNVTVNATSVVAGAVFLAQVLLDEVEITSGGSLTAHDIIVKVREHLDRHDQ